MCVYLIVIPLFTAVFADVFHISSAGWVLTSNTGAKLCFSLLAKYLEQKVLWAFIKACLDVSQYFRHSSWYSHQRVRSSCFHLCVATARHARTECNSLWTARETNYYALQNETGILNLKHMTSALHVEPDTITSHATS